MFHYPLIPLKRSPRGDILIGQLGVQYTVAQLRIAASFFDSYPIFLSGRG